MAKVNMTLEEKLEDAVVKDGPYEVQGNWVWANLGSLLKTMTTKKPDDSNEFFRYIDIDAIDNKNQRIREPKVIKVKDAPSRASREVLEGDVLFSTVRPYLRNIALVTSEYKDCIATTGFYICRSNGVLESKYLYNILCSERTVNYYTSMMKGDNSPSIRKEEFESLNVPIPPLKEQQRIVDRIESLFEKVDKAKELIEEAREGFEKRKDVILEKAFSGELTEEWRNNNHCENVGGVLKYVAENRIQIYISELEKDKKFGKRPGYNKPILEDNVLPEENNMHLPNSWRLCYIKNISEIVRGASPRPAGDPKYFGGEIPWITVKELTKDDNVYMTDVEQYLTEEGKGKSRFINEGTLLLTNSGATLGVPKITSINGCINDGILSFAKLYSVDKRYAYYYLKSQTKKFRLINQGAAQPNLNTDIVKNWLIPFAPESEQKEIVRILDKLLEEESKIEELTQLEDQIELIKKSILAKAFRGELGTNCEEGESALELLKEILSKN